MWRLQEESGEHWLGTWAWAPRAALRTSRAGGVAGDGDLGWPRGIPCLCLAALMDLPGGCV